MKKFLFASRLFLLACMFTIATAAKAQPFGGVLAFDGVNDQLSVSGYPIPANSDFTIEYWFRTCQSPSGFGLPQVVVGNSNKVRSLIYSVTPGANIYELCAQYGSSNEVCHQDHSYAYDSLWHHMAITYNVSTDLFELYYDGISGTLSTSYNYNFYPDATLTLGIGTYQAMFHQPYEGYLDELRISNIIRYPAAFTPQTTPFVTDANTRALWHFEDANPLSSVIDNSGNGFNFTTTGNPGIIHLDNLISQSGNVLTVAGTFQSYQWIDCSTGLPVQGETGQSFNPASSGTYAVVVSTTNCTIVSDCFVHVTDGANETPLFSKISLYPNPVNDQLTIGNIPAGTSSLTITDMLGHIIYYGPVRDKQMLVDTSAFAQGIYFITLISGTGERASLKFARN